MYAANSKVLEIFFLFYNCLLQMKITMQGGLIKHFITIY